MVLSSPKLLYLSPKSNPIRVLQGLISGYDYTYNWVISTLNLQVRVGGVKRGSPGRDP